MEHDIAFLILYVRVAKAQICYSHISIPFSGSPTLYQLRNKKPPNPRVSVLRKEQPLEHESGLHLS